MASSSSQFDSKGVQTDSNLGRYSSKFLQILRTYINAVCQYRLHLFNQYTQSNEYQEHEDLFNVRNEILQRFQFVINELEQAIGNIQRQRLTETDVQQILNQTLIKEVIEASLEANISSSRISKSYVPQVDEWRNYRRILQETKEDIHLLDFLLHRGISKIDRLVNVTSLYV